MQILYRKSNLIKYPQKLHLPFREQIGYKLKVKGSWRRTCEKLLNQFRSHKRKKWIGT